MGRCSVERGGVNSGVIWYGSRLVARRSRLHNNPKTDAEDAEDAEEVAAGSSHAGDGGVEQ